MYLDFSKAPEIMAHKILLEKLIEVGFDLGTVKWTENQLSDST